MKTIELKYGNTNTFYIEGDAGGLLVDTDYAGTLSSFYRALKQNGKKVSEIEYVLVTHYHPDHMGLVGELTRQNVKLLLLDCQKEFVHYSDAIFARDRLESMPIDENQAIVISCAQSREYLLRMGISGEIVHTPSHSPDSISLVLDNGDCLVGDLEPFEYIRAYEDNQKLKSDWEKIMALKPKRVFFAHAPESPFLIGNYMDGDVIHDVPQVSWIDKQEYLI